MIYVDPTHILMNLLSSKKFKDTETINCIQTAIHNIEQLKLNNINGFNYVNMQVSKLKSELEELNNRSCESCKYYKPQEYDLKEDILDQWIYCDWIYAETRDLVNFKKFYCSNYEAKGV